LGDPPGDHGFHRPKLFFAHAIRALDWGVCARLSSIACPLFRVGARAALGCFVDSPRSGL
jgi:hypothetical protein